MRNYRNYDVWVKAHQLTLFVYREILPVLPKSEQFALALQMKRAAYSIPMNIAEGCGRNSDDDFARFLDLKYFDNEKNKALLSKVDEVKAKLIKLIKTIRKS
jgi:hypothetical protein